MTQFYTELMLVEELLSGTSMHYKKANLSTGLAEAVKSYISSKIDPQNPTASVLNILAPGGIWLLFKALNLGFLGTIISLLMNVYHVNVGEFITSVYDKVKQLLSNGKVSSSQIDEAINSSINEPQLNSLNLLQSAKIIKLAALEYERESFRLSNNVNLIKYAGKVSSALTILGKVLGVIFKLVLASAGLMVAGDVVNKFLNRPNSLDGTYQAGSESVNDNIPKQTKYVFKQDETLPKEYPLTNTMDNINNMLIQFAKDTYSGLDGKESLIENSPWFQTIKNKIAFANAYNPGSATIMIPSAFTSKKQLVDHFIDEVAQQDA